MLDYNKMDNVLKNLEDATQNMKSVTELQEYLKGQICVLDEVRKEIEQSNISISNMLSIQEKGFTNHEECLHDIEERHKELNDKIDRVFEDYKKLNSAFELLELGLKRNVALIEDVKGVADNGKKILDEHTISLSSIKSTVEEIDKTLKELDLRIQNTERSLFEILKEIEIINKEISIVKKQNKGLICGMIIGGVFIVATFVISLIGLFV